ncbi:MAG: oligopeptide transporter, OPT family [Deltaproteobacteria bacterium]|nr:oligopeptide transporter, OPT family [Deltaproteobacteria bacterium]
MDSQTPAAASPRELTLRAVGLGLVLAIVLGAANAYLGLKVGMTISATFPAAVIAIAAFRLRRSRHRAGESVLEQNIARTTAAVGEGLAAAGIFTLPALLLVKIDGVPVWGHFDYWQSVGLLTAGALLGPLLLIPLRRALTQDPALPFPESHACYELVRSGQGGDANARYVCGAIGAGMLTELGKNSAGLTVIRDTTTWALPLPGGQAVTVAAPLASPALLSVGFIIGPLYSFVTAAGGALGWLLLVPILLLLQHDATLSSLTPSELTTQIWRSQVRPIAVGAMLVAALATLWGLRHSIVAALQHARRRPGVSTTADAARTQDLPTRAIVPVALGIAAVLGVVVFTVTRQFGLSLILVPGVVVTSFLVSIVGAWLVGLIGGSNQPVSGLTLCVLLLMGLCLLPFSIPAAPAAALLIGGAAVTCAATGLAGNLIQEVKIGELLGASPWKMELVQLLTTALVALTTVAPMVLLHESAAAKAVAMGGLPIGIGGAALPAPQANLMAQIVTALLGGTIAWQLVGVGIGLGLLMVLCRVPAPMLVAVGMYLPLDASLAIALGGICRWLLQRTSRAFDPNRRGIMEHRATLIASGLIAGEALMGVLLAGVVLGLLHLAESTPAQYGHLAQKLSLAGWWTGQSTLGWYHAVGGWLAFAVFALTAAGMIGIPRWTTQRRTSRLC